MKRPHRDGGFDTDLVGYNCYWPLAFLLGHGEAREELRRERESYEPTVGVAMFGICIFCADPAHGFVSRLHARLRTKDSTLGRPEFLHKLPLVPAPTMEQIKLMGKSFLDACLSISGTHRTNLTH